MFLYDSQKRLIAASETGVKKLGFPSVKAFFEDVEDLAQLFVQKPGYVYRFKNFSWIDFIVFNPSKTHRVIVESTGMEEPISVSMLEAAQGALYYVVQIGVTAKEFHYDNVVKIDTLEDLQKDEASQVQEPVDTAVPEREFESQTSIELQLDEEESKEEAALTIDLIQEEQPPQKEVVTKEVEEPQESVEISLQPQKEEELAITLDDTQQLQTLPIDTSATQEYALDRVAQELEIDEAMLKELLAEFLEQANELRPQIYDSLAQGESKRAKELIHKIKGAVANLRIRSLDSILAQTQGVYEPGKLTQIMDAFYRRLEDVAQEFEALGVPVPKPTEQTLSLVATQEDEKEEHAVEGTVLDTSVNQEEQLVLSLQEEREDGIASLIAQAGEELGLEQKDIEELVKEYLFRAVGAKNHLLQLKRAGYEENFYHLLHQLKGSALNLRLRTFANILDEIKRGEPHAFEHYDEELQRFADYFGLELNMELTPQMAQRNAQELGIDVSEYEEFVTEFVQELQKSIEQVDFQQIKKLHSIAINLRLGFVAAALEALLENRDVEHYKEQLKEWIKRYKGTL